MLFRLGLLVLQGSFKEVSDRVRLVLGYDLQKVTARIALETLKWEKMKLARSSCWELFELGQHGFMFVRKQSRVTRD